MYKSNSATTSLTEYFGGMMDPHLYWLYRENNVSQQVMQSGIALQLKTQYEPNNILIYYTLSMEPQKNK